MTYLSNDFAVEVTARPEYFTRESDNFTSEHFGTLDKDLAKQLLAKFPTEILQHSLRTKILPFVHDLCVEYVKQSIVTPFFEHTELVINTYPVYLADVEADALIRGLITYLGTAVSISVAYLTPKQITPSFLKEEYLAVIMYDYVDWFNMHTDELKKTNLRNIGFYVPRLWFGNSPTDDAIAEAKKNKTEPFELMSRIMAPFVVMQFLPIAHYCIDAPNNLPEYSILVK